VNRLGVLGGTFDPPHRAHLEMGRLARASLALDGVLLVPVNVPSHKAVARTSFEHRLAMTRLLAAEEPGFEASDIQGRMGGLSYTIDLLRALRTGQASGTALFFLFGADSFEELHTWREVRSLFDEATLVAISRPGHVLANPKLPPDLAGRVVQVPGLAMDVSSTAIRRRLAEGGDASDVMTEPVAAYVRRHGLYRQAAP
jgi:nicotinate-nucleotide adenylyltransferase